MEDILIYKIPEYLSNNTFLQGLSIIKKNEYLLIERRKKIHKLSNELFLERFIYTHDIKNIDLIKRFISNTVGFNEVLKELAEHFLLNKYDNYNTTFHEISGMNYPQIIEKRVVCRSYLNIYDDDSIIYEENYPICATYRVPHIMRLFIRNNLNVKALIY